MKYTLLLILNLTCLSFVYAQTIKPSVSVDHHTGTGIINMPLYTLRSGNLTLPISLAYDASGMRVEESGYPYKEHSEYVEGKGLVVVKRNTLGRSNSIKVATGWHLTAGGVIKREIKSLPDDYLGGAGDPRQGWLHGTNAAVINNFYSASDNNLGDGDDEQTDYNNINNLANIDTEPDVFSFNFGEFSGKFVFDHTTPNGSTQRPIRTIPYQDFKISYTLLNNAISEFQIITNTGIIYLFKSTVVVTKSNHLNPAGFLTYFNSSYLRYTTPLTYTEEWGLYSISTPGSSLITIQYHEFGAEPVADQISYVQKELNSNTYVTNFGHAEVKTISYQVPIVAYGTSASVSFSAEGVNITDYENFRAPIVFSKQYYSGRTFLKSISEEVNCVKLAEYNFEYEGNLALPDIDSKAVDFWGYFNGKTNNDVSYPKIYVYPSLSGKDRYRLRPIPGNTSYYLLDGADRDVDPDAVTAGLLKEITTSSKGKIKLEYESNEYYDATANAKFKGAGVRVKKVTYNDGINTSNDIVKEYEYDIDGGRLLYEPVYAYAIPMYKDAVNGTTQRYPSQESGENLYKLFTHRSVRDLSENALDNPGVVYQTVSEKELGKGKTVFTYSVPATSGEISTTDYSSPYNYMATIAKVARSNQFVLPDHGIFENGYNTFPFAQNTNYDFERGLLLNAKAYNETGTLVKELQYTYSRIAKDTQPYVIKALKIESHLVNNSNGPFYYFGQYSILADVNKVIATEKDILIDPLNAGKKLVTQKNYFHESLNHRLVTRTAVTNSAGVITQTKTKYAGDFSVTLPGSTVAEALFGLNEQNMHATPIEIVSTITRPGEGEKVTGAALTQFRKENLNSVYFPAVYRYFPDKAFTLRINSPVTDFNSLTVTSSGGNADLLKDSRYKVTNSFLNWDKFQRIPIEIMDDKRNLRSLIMDPGRPSLIQADISNARLTEVAFSSFTKTNPTPITGRNPQYSAIALAPSETLSRTGIMRNASSPTYNFSCWINSTGSGNLTVTLFDGVSTVSSIIPYANSSGGWKFYKIKINVESLSTTFSANIQSGTAIAIDHDILLYPSNADIKYYTYNNYGKSSDNDINGNTIFYTYDMFGRLTHVRDKNNHILKRITPPTFLPESHVVSSDFTLPVNGPGQLAKVGVGLSFSAKDLCTSGAIFTWNFGDGTAPVTGAYQSHIFQQLGEYTVTVTSTHPQYGGTTTTKTIKVYRNIDVGMCTTGPSSHNNCTNVSTYYAWCGGTQESPGDNTFTVNITGASNSAIITYAWEYTTQVGGPWMAATNTGNTFYRYSATDAIFSYKVRCKVTITDNMFNEESWNAPTVIEYNPQIDITYFDCN